MKIKSLCSIIVSLALFGTESTCFAGDFETWKEQITCGEATYKLESICKKGGTDELNECKSQSLEIIGRAGSRQVKIPELNKLNANIYKENYGDIKDLFIVGWACGKDGNVLALNLYYSVSGGAAESSASYDASGKLIEDDRFPTFKKAIYDARKNMIYIRSVMPN